MAFFIHKFFSKLYVIGTHLNHLGETNQLSTHSIGFDSEFLIFLHILYNFAFEITAQSLLSGSLCDSKNIKIVLLRRNDSKNHRLDYMVCAVLSCSTLSRKVLESGVKCAC